MANQKKPATKKSTEDLHTRLSPILKKRVTDAFESGITDKNGEPYESLSDWVRTLLESDIRRWENTKS